MSGRTVVVKGVVHTRERREAVTTVVREALPGMEVDKPRRGVGLRRRPGGGAAGMIRLAAAGDVHAGADSAGKLRPRFQDLPGQADLLLLAGDLTRRGHPEEAEVLAAELGGIGVPMVAVLGNHDYHLDREDEVAGILSAAGVRVLEGEATVVEANGARVGVAGTKGFGGGFAGKCATDFGEPQMKAFVRHTKGLAAGLERALRSLQPVQLDLRVALLHYSPVEATLEGEPLEIWPFLGSYLLAEAVDRGGADLVLHGHAHRGSERGETAGGVPVRNVAWPVTGRPYTVFHFEEIKPRVTALD